MQSKNQSIHQIASGLYSFLSHPRIYNSFQWAVGAEAGRAKIIREFVSPKENLKVLDIGCGAGKMIEYLPKGTEYWGYDLSPQYIRFAQRKYEGRGKFFCENVENVPRKECGFDIVFALGLLHHLDDSKSSSLFNVAYDCLKKGGCIITLDGVYSPDQSFFSKFFVSRDRGRHVRNADEYLSLAQRRFEKVEAHLIHGLFTIPYSNYVMLCYK